MTLGERITSMDAWLLDKVFQPLADRLPDRLSPFDVGMSLQLGSILMTAVVIAGVFFMSGMTAISDMLYNVLGWVLYLTFFIGTARMRALVKVGQANPLRYMLLSLRVLSIGFMAYKLYEAVSAPMIFAMIVWPDACGSVVFAMGLYFISCQPPSPWRQTRKQTHLRPVFVRSGNGF
ncbi:hypothetical protein OQ496_02040 [Acetobacter suratthaniensis]|uniref:Uncharacterized protein n=1 Tax=Acetobacter suratthaniensis TaxID=1502841 RepID=A0ABS3LHS1_9PROT|nr:hypothetical protein [Acetobacter suratthaniensis]MBO1327154.1 hypothetical protein [Acetobacter suratthaniensis]MCX2565234.1 hypothetical protein [Acetobacter suratthaniensis]